MPHLITAKLTVSRRTTFGDCKNGRNESIAVQLAYARAWPIFPLLPVVAVNRRRSRDRNEENLLDTVASCLLITYLRQTCVGLLVSGASAATAGRLSMVPSREVHGSILPTDYCRVDK